MARFYVFIAHGFEEVEALSTVDFLRRAGIEVVTAGVGSKTVTGAHGIPVVCDKLIEELSDDFDGVVLPGGMPGMVNLDKSEYVQSFLKKTADNNRYMCAICASPSVLGRAGYLKGKRATCYPGFEAELKGAEVCFDSVCVDGKIITSRAPGTAYDFALKIIEKVCSAQVSEKVRKGLIYLD